jgi:hypothetical protein
VGSMTTIRPALFVKGNADLRDPLHSLRAGRDTLWSGINQTLRETQRGFTVRVIHETSIGFTPLLLANGTVPKDVALRGELFGPFPPSSQCSAAVFAPEHAAIVLSIHGDVSVRVVRHRTTGALLHPYGWERWPEADRTWLTDDYEAVPPLDAQGSMGRLLGIVDRIRGVSDAPILVSNLSSIMPGDTIHAYRGVGETYAQRVRRFNLALVDAAVQADFSIVDVERIVAEGGAARLRTDAIHLTAEGCRRVAAEVVRILDDYGTLPMRPCA